MTPARIASAIALTLFITYFVPLPIYGTLSVITGMEPPTEDSIGQFMLSVAVMKLGVAIAFVLLYALARESWIGQWPRYAFVWWIMFALIEVGQAIMPDYTAIEAFGGIVSEAIYFPLSAMITARLLMRGEDGKTG